MASSAFQTRHLVQVAVSILIASGLPACGSNPEVARINESSIRLDEYERQLRVLKSIRPETRLDEATRRQVLEQMVKQEVLVQEARKLGLDKEPAVQEAMKRQGDTVRAELNQSIANAKAQLDQLDRAVEQKILIERLLDAKKASVTVSEKDLKGAWETRRAQSAAPLPPIGRMKDQLAAQVILEKLVDQARVSQRLEIFPEAAARAKAE